VRNTGLVPDKTLKSRGRDQVGRVEFFYQATTMCVTPSVYGVLYGFTG